MPENRLLTDEELEAIPVTNLGGNTDDLNIAKAQLAKDMEWEAKKIEEARKAGKEEGKREIMEWIEDTASLEEYKDGRRWRKDGMLIPWEEYQAKLTSLNRGG